jgi:hypothetical protein
VTLVNCYTDLESAKRQADVTNGKYDTDLELVITTVSRWIDAHCGRRFYRGTALEERTFEPDATDRIAVDDIADLTGIEVSVDVGGTGDFTSWDATGFQAWPYNAASSGPEPQPWTELRAVGQQAFPSIDGRLGRRDRVKVNAIWGWPQVPSVVRSACLLQVGRLFKRRSSPEGVAGFGQFGDIRIQRLDPDVVALLDDGDFYVRRLYVL